MKTGLISKEEAERAERIINEIWRAMVGGFQQVDPALASQWGAQQPVPYVDRERGRMGLSMHCQKLDLSITVAKDVRTGLYLVGCHRDEAEATTPITVTPTLSEIAPAIIDYIK